MNQTELDVSTSSRITFQIYGAEYQVRKAERNRNEPSYFVVRMRDMHRTKRYYSWPDGAFSAVLWERCSWIY